MSSEFMGSMPLTSTPPAPSRLPGTQYVLSKRLLNWMAKGFSSRCVLWCSARWVLQLNASPHSLHLNGFSPEWVF